MRGVRVTLPANWNHSCMCMSSLLHSLPNSSTCKSHLDYWKTAAEMTTTKPYRGVMHKVVGRTGISLPLLDCGIYFELRSVWTLMLAKLVWTWNPRVLLWVLEECSSDGDDTLWCKCEARAKPQFQFEKNLNAAEQLQRHFHANVSLHLVSAGVK